MLWITGSKGLLGSALCAALPEGVPFLETGREVDIADLESVRAFSRKNPGMTHIVNCAAFSQVDAAEDFKDQAYRTNAVGPENLAIVAKESGAKLIHISTDYVFDGKGRKPLTEKDPTGPRSTYGKTKLEGEERALNQGACVIRTSWIFGSGGKNFVSKLLKMLQTQPEIRLTDDQWGRFTYAPDLAAAILKMLDKEGLYQYANMGVATKYEFGLAMREEAFLLGFPIMTDAIIPVPGSCFPAPCERPTYSAFDTTKIEQIVTIRHWREALKDFLCEQMPAYS
ncbi:MAG: dTDP-4-dehydrorhamnose reductase [Parachlamydiales bacterium]|nr:dTDP-4-dehydrorhamnose reductase [Parachlamydiales bacterium]